MTARTLIGMVGLTLALLTVPLAAEAQQAGNVSRIGFLGTGSPAETE